MEPTRARGTTTVVAAFVLVLGFAALPGFGAATALAAMLSPGDPFPEWRLADSTGREVSSKDYAGRRYLLWFYPKARTPG